MKIKHHFCFRVVPLLSVLLSLSACMSSTHPIQKASLGKSVDSAQMEKNIEQAGPVKVSTISSADWSVALSGLVNLKNPKAATLKDHDEAIKVFAHLIEHPKYGSFLIDTGVSEKLIKNPEQYGIHALLQKAMKIQSMQLTKSTAQIVQGLSSPLAGVFMTHLHIDHISGMPDIPNQVAVYIGQHETTQTYFLNAFTQSPTDQLLAGKGPLQEWDFGSASDQANSFAAIVDVFSDGSVYALSVPGHTAGSTAYLVRSQQGPVLFVGDTCHTLWGWQHTVEPGDFTRNHELNHASLVLLKELVTRHPAIDVRLGHQ